VKEVIIAAGMLAKPVFDRDTVIYSDRHSNREGKQNNFERELFHDWIFRYVDEGYLLIDCGDSFDVLEALRLRPILDYNYHLEAFLARTTKYLAPGNHDGELDRLPTWLNYTILRDPAKWSLAYIAHGHLLDEACHGRGRLDIIAGRVWAVLEFCGLGRVLGGVKARVERWAARRRPTASKRARLDSADPNYDGEVHACDVLESREIEGGDLILYITGHTHKAELFEFASGRWYANPGAWTERGNCHAIRVRGRVIELLRIAD
jgi:UDP-2,3-diacylglucosamine pyrophosphatase LpxH